MQNFPESKKFLFGVIGLLALLMFGPPIWRWAERTMANFQREEEKRIARCIQDSEDLDGAVVSVYIDARKTDYNDFNVVSVSFFHNQKRYTVFPSRADPGYEVLRKAVEEMEQSSFKEVKLRVRKRDPGKDPKKFNVLCGEFFTFERVR